MAYELYPIPYPLPPPLPPPPAEPPAHAAPLVVVVVVGGAGTAPGVGAGGCSAEVVAGRAFAAVVEVVGVGCGAVAIVGAAVVVGFGDGSPVTEEAAEDGGSGGDVSGVDCVVVPGVSVTGVSTAAGRSELVVSSDVRGVDMPSVSLVVVWVE